MDLKTKIQNTKQINETLKARLLKHFDEISDEQKSKLEKALDKVPADKLIAIKSLEKKFIREIRSDAEKYAK
jgi:hypothetical protein